MIDRKTRLKWRRNFRKSRRQVEDISVQAEEHLERHFIRRLTRLNDVRRFVLGWLFLVVALIGAVVVQTRALSYYYQDLRPVPGGIYAEGIVGTFTNANPIYAAGSVDSAVSKLVFASLFKYDADNNLVGDLAKSWAVDPTGKKYTVELKDNLFWHDGVKLTASDVIFTYRLIQDPDAKSPLFSSWQGVKVSATDSKTVEFQLNSSLSSFPHSLTGGIVPKHKLESINTEQLRSSDFNTISPVGSGPFKWSVVEVEGDTPESREEKIGLVKNEGYHGGEPALQQFVIRTFRSEERLLESFRDQEINAMVGLDSIPDTLSEELPVVEYNIPLTGSVMAFFNTKQELLKDKSVRQALVKAVDVNELVKGLGYPAIPVRGPFLKIHVGFNPKLTQFKVNKAHAEKILDEAGWLKADDGIRAKNNKQLSLKLYAQNTSEFTYVTQFLQSKWKDIGVNVEVIQPDDDEFQSNVIINHNYDIVIYGLSLGTDPDVFAYWHSSQADIRAQNRLNFSEYESEEADQSLESGRTRLDTELRIVKYEPFLKAWREDAPALAMYRPRFLYAVRGGLFNFEQKSINSASDRFANVENWMIRQAKFNK